LPKRSSKEAVAVYPRRRPLLLIKKQRRKEVMKDILSIIKNGFLGYAAFFSTLIVAKLFAALIGTFYFKIITSDLELCSIGFVLAALIRFLEILKQKKETETSHQVQKQFH
jgi:hypothetical protein